MGPALIDGIVATRNQLPPEGAIFASWHLGYLITDVSQRATFDDGLAPDPVLNYLFARAVTGDDPSLLSQLTAFLSTQGREGLAAVTARAKSPDALIASIRDGAAPFETPVALLLHQRMLREFPAAFTTGHWDFGRDEGPLKGYDERVCAVLSPGALVCRRRGHRDLPIDLDRGLVGNKKLRRVVYIDRGQVVEETTFQHSEGYTLQLMPREGLSSSGYTAQLIVEEIYTSNFNQLFMLGRPLAGSGLELIVDDWPRLRSYRVHSP
jgi:hypothetical protein